MENQENKEVTRWSKLMFAILNIPGAKVDRIEFLVEALRPHCTDEEIKKAALQRPIDVIPLKLINHWLLNVSMNKLKRQQFFLPLQVCQVVSLSFLLYLLIYYNTIVKP